MNRDSYLTVFLAICCIGAAGMASTTLASSLAEDPDDVVDVDYSELPIGKDEGSSVRGAVQNGERQSQSGGSDREDVSNPQGQSDEPGDSSEQSAAADSRDEPPDDATGGESGDEPNSGGSGDESNSGGTGSSGSGGGTGPLSFLQQLWLLLEGLLPWLVLLVVLALAYRYRRNLLALVLAVAAVVGDRTGGRSGTDTRWPSAPPSNDVHQAWLSMVDRLDIDEPQTRTPSECASAAVDANMNPTAVQTLTNVFEEVRYGEKPVTDERRQRARDGLRRLQGGETR